MQWQGSGRLSLAVLIVSGGYAFKCKGHDISKPLGVLSIHSLAKDHAKRAVVAPNFHKANEAQPLVMVVRWRR